MGLKNSLLNNKFLYQFDYINIMPLRPGRTPGKPMKKGFTPTSREERARVQLKLIADHQKGAYIGVGKPKKTLKKK